MRLLFAIAIAPALLLASCFDAQYRDDLQCGPGFNCPIDYTCDVNRNLCLPRGSAIPDCDPVNDTGCQSGMKCGLDASNRAVCVSAGSGLQGTSCTIQGVNDTCASKFRCNVANGEGAICRRYCALDGSTPCPLQTGQQTTCVPLNATIGQCERTCDLLANDCGGSDACYFATPAPLCRPAGSKPAGATCDKVEECAQGTSCVAVSGTKTCRAYCNTTGGAPMCSGGQTCAPQGPQPSFGFCF